MCMCVCVRVRVCVCRFVTGFSDTHDKVMNAGADRRMAYGTFDSFVFFHRVIENHQ